MGTRKLCLKPVGGPSTGLCSLQFIMWMVHVTLDVGKELRPYHPGFSCLCCLSLVRCRALGQDSKLVEMPPYEQGSLCELELSA